MKIDFSKLADTVLSQPGSVSSTMTNESAEKAAVPTKQQWLDGIENSSEWAKIHIRRGNELCARSFAEETAFYAFKAHPELRESVPPLPEGVGQPTMEEVRPDFEAWWDDYMDGRSIDCFHDEAGRWNAKQAAWSAWHSVKVALEAENASLRTDGDAQLALKNYWRTESECLEKEIESLKSTLATVNAENAKLLEQAQVSGARIEELEGEMR